MYFGIHVDESVRQAHRLEVGAHTSTAETGLRSRSNPIDHIFQFHKALKRDLVALEESAQRFNAAVQESNTPHSFSAVSPAIATQLSTQVTATYCLIHAVLNNNRGQISASLWPILTKWYQGYNFYIR